MNRRVVSILAGLLFVPGISLGMGTTLTIEFKTPVSKQGTIHLSLFEKQGSDAFPAGSKQKNLYLKAKLPVAGASSVYKSKSLPAGVYAVSAYHDVNNDDMMATNFMGLPTEPWGVSNNIRNSFSPPKFEQSQFKIESGSSDHRISIILKN